MSRPSFCFFALYLPFYGIYNYILLFPVSIVIIIIIIIMIIIITTIIVDVCTGKVRKLRLQNDPVTYTVTIDALRTTTLNGLTLRCRCKPKPYLSGKSPKFSYFFDSVRKFRYAVIQVFLA